MANPTTNYSFAMPTNTDLVKDLPADFETFGQAVDTKIKDLNPETTAGDISYRGSTANAKTRLPIGTAGQVLKVNSGATAPEWATINAGGMTLINETVASGLSSLSFSSIASTYKDLYLEWSGINHSNNTTEFGIRFNNDSGSNYTGRVFEMTDTTITPVNHSGTTISYWPAFGNGVNLNPTTFFTGNVTGRLKISNYASAKKKTYELSFAFYDNGNSRYNGQLWMPNFYNSTSAITSIDIVRTSGAGTFSNIADTSIRLYGVA